MKNIRIGNDINVAWSILLDDAPFNLEGKDIKLYLKDIYGKKEINDYSISGNVISWTFFGKDQEHTGKYGLELIINEDNEGMISTDACNLVCLVPHSCYDCGEDDENVKTENVRLTTNLEYVANVGGGSIDPELLEGYIPLSRDFSDDFNNDFAR